MDKGKIITIFLWLALLTNFLLNGYSFFNYFALMLVSIHFFEFLIFFKRIARSSDVSDGFVLTLVFGLLHIKDLKK
jgi:uncharacterized protein YhhL (DUF1145 family)|tara:strand:- start:2174 stop:2401 length:228 start_codon:yes stop_codon:yes gene_type:complete